MKRVLIGCVLAVAGLASTLAVGVTPASAATVERTAGTDRYSTAVEISKVAFTPDTDTVYVATGNDFADALTAGPAAATRHAPVLLTQPGSLPDVTKAEIQRLTPTTIVIVGGTNSVSTAVEDQLHGLATTVRRIAGDDRYQTAQKISADAFSPGVAAAFVASGTAFPDALAGGAAAAAVAGPILLTDAGTLPAATSAELDRLKPTATVILGGASSVSDGVASQVNQFATAARWAGPDRFATSAGISRKAFPSGAPVVFLATGRSFPDALAGSAAAAQMKGALLLVDRDCVSRAVNAEIDRLQPGRIILLGGQSSATDNVVARHQCPDTGAKVLNKDISSVTSTGNTDFGSGTIGTQSFSTIVYSYANCSSICGPFYREYDLKGMYASFTTTAGQKSDSVRTGDTYKLEILLDGVVAYSKQFTGLTDSAIVNLNVVGVQRIRLQFTQVSQPANAYPAFGGPTVYTS